MKSVSVIIVLCTLPAGMGVIVDRLMLRRHKGRLHNALLRYWLHLEELSLPDIWRVFAAYTIRFFSLVFGKKILSFRFIITLILVSFCLTFCAISLGDFLESLEQGVEFELSHIMYIMHAWAWAVCLLINLVFDTATGLVTVKVLSVIHRSTPCKAIALIVIDIILAFLFAISCFTFAMFFIEDLNTEVFLEVPTRVYRNITNLVFGEPEVLIIDDIELFSIRLWGILFAGTTLIPTFIYLTLLATLIISKAILGIGIRVTKYFLERATEVDKSKDLAVFTLTGSLFSVIVLLLTTFTMLRQALQ